MCSEDTPDGVLVEIHLECLGDLLSYSAATVVRVALLQFDDGMNELLRRSFRTGLPHRVDENKRRYFRFFECIVKFQ